MKYCYTIVFFLLITCFVQGETDYCFRVYLNDKGNSVYTLENPETYLSSLSLERRIKNKLEITDSDLPISSHYIDSLTNQGGKVVVQSKWFSTVVIAGSDSLLAEQLQTLSIVDSVKLVWKGNKYELKDAKQDSSLLVPMDKVKKEFYGYGQEQIKMLNGIKLHDAGFRGEGMSIAVIDAGFMNVDRISVFNSLKLAGTYNVVFPERSVFEEDDHGTKVLSCMAANMPGIMVGTAPEASYWLIKSEDNHSEYPIEEDFWTAAVEFADSVGVDLISSSLGYFMFDDKELDYDPSLLDGKTALISQAAQMASEKGILVFSSAGNEGNGNWEKITFPGDADNILTIGSITERKNKSAFSSVGFTADYRVKPDLVALGTGCTVIDAYGNVRYANGTSFSTPIVAGLGACLWQALPDLTNQEIMQLMKKMANQYERPDAELGYGIPDVYKAYKQGKKYVAQNKTTGE